MMKTEGASLAESSPPTPYIRVGLTNPATRFRKLFPYLGAALVLIIAAAGYATIRGMATSRDWLGQTYQVKSELADVELNRALLHEYQTEAIPNTEKQEGLQSAAEALLQSLGRLKEATQDNAAQHERIEQLEPLLEQHVQQVQSATLGGAGESNSEQDARINRIIVDIDTRESQLLGERQAAWDRQFHRNIAVLGFAVCACLLLLFTNMHLLREDVRSSRIATEHIRDSADSYRALSSRIIRLQDAERRRIGRELHDSVGQILGALQMNLEQLEAAQGAASSALIAESRELVQRTAKE